MDFDLPPHDDPRRSAVRSWLAECPRPTGRQLAEAGFVVPHWPRPYGIDADPIHQLIIDEELNAAGIQRPSNPIGIGWAAPTVVMAGSEEQKQRFLWPALSGEQIWCQLFSEPDAGSDLASLRTRAERDGDEWVINGSKIWTSGAHLADFGILLARTNFDVPDRRGISYFICPMDTPGITIMPITAMTGSHSFNQVFFDNVHLTEDLLVGEVDDGWRLAKATLANERISLSSGGALWGNGPSAADLVRCVRSSGFRLSPLQRREVAKIYIEGEVLRLIQQRALSARVAGRTPGPEASIQKLFADEHGQRVMEIAKSLAGTSGMLSGSGPVGDLPVRRRSGVSELEDVHDLIPGVDRVWHWGWLFSPALTIGGGTWAVQRNIIGEHVLGLPKA
jgi:3-oxochol-4-en-24-oyl-CoA dehydrogenase